MTASLLTDALPAARRPLAGATLGVVQILWANDDLPELTPQIDAETILAEMSRLGYRGTQLGSSFPKGQALNAALRRHGLRIAEVYAGLPCTVDGPGPEALQCGIAALDRLVEADGDMLVAALRLSPERVPLAGRAVRAGVPRLTQSGLTALAALVERLGVATRAAGKRLVFHQHVGTFIETPGELAALAEATDAGDVGICLDVGHYLVGGGDPVAALRDYGERVRHVHLKDVAASPLGWLRAGANGGFLDALRERIFCELGSGVLDVANVLRVLAARDYHGWIMVEQDTTWRPPSESAAMSRAVYEMTLRVIGSGAS